MQTTRGAEPESKFDENLCKKIDELGLPVSAENSLKGKGVTHVYQLLTHNDDELLNFKDFNPEVLKDVEGKLSELGLSLGQDLPADIEEICQKITGKDGDTIVDPAFNKNLCKTVDGLRLAVKARDCLKDNGIEYVYQLVKLSEDELAAFKDFNKAAMKDVLEKLTLLGVKLGQEVPEDIETLCQNVAAAAAVVSVPEPAEPAFSENLCRKVDEIGLSVRAVSCLNDNDIEYVYQLVKCTEDELNALKDFSQGALQEVQDKLAEFGLHLGMTLSDDVEERCRKSHADLKKSPAGDVGHPEPAPVPEPTPVPEPAPVPEPTSVLEPNLLPEPMPVSTPEPPLYRGDPQTPNGKNWQALVKPRLIDNSDLDNRVYGKFVYEPWERGYGTTIGNAMRRVLLSSLQGAAFVAVKIPGVQHEFTTIHGVLEDITDVVLNIKQVRLQMNTDVPQRLGLKVTGKREVTAGDIQVNHNVKVLNPEQHIATLTEEVTLEMELEARMGKGYVSAEGHEGLNEEIGLIKLDSSFSPVRKVAYAVEQARVGQMTNYDRLILEVWTDGSLRPESAIAISAKIIKEQMTVFINFQEDEEISITNNENLQIPLHNLCKKIDVLELSVRATNCLKNANISYVYELVQRTEQDMLKTKNFGKKTLDEIRSMLLSMDLNFGQPVPPGIERMCMECGLQLEVPQPGKTKKQQEAPFNECLCKTIAEMDMSARAERCLSDNEVKYIYDLVQMSENELKSFKDMDSDILDEIRDELAKLDLGFEETVSSDIVKQCQKWRKDLAKQSGGLKAQEPELDMEVTLNVNLYKNIEDIGLSERTKNCMKLNGIDYVYQLVTKTDKDLRKIKDVGPSALEEIEKALEGLDLALEQKLPPDIEERFKSWRKENVHEADDDNLHKKVDELGLSERAKNCMKEANIESVEQLIKYTREGLLKIKDFNDSALKELEKTLKEMGLSLAESAS